VQLSVPQHPGPSIVQLFPVVTHAWHVPPAHVSVPQQAVPPLVHELPSATQGAWHVPPVHVSLPQQVAPPPQVWPVAMHGA